MSNRKSDSVYTADEEERGREEREEPDCPTGDGDAVIQSHQPVEEQQRAEKRQVREDHAENRHGPLGEIVAGLYQEGIERPECRGRGMDTVSPVGDQDVPVAIPVEKRFEEMSYATGYRLQVEADCGDRRTPDRLSSSDGGEREHQGEMD